MSVYSWTLLGFFALWAAPAAGQDTQDPPRDYTEMGLEELTSLEIVYGASTYEQDIARAPSAVTVVTAEEIRAFGYRTVAEVVGSQAGCYVTSDRNYEHVGIRGFCRPGDYDSRMLVLVDGEAINNNIDLSASPGTEFPVDLDLVERIEVIRGPSSSLYGSSAFFGVVNIVLLDGADLDGTRISASGGSGADYRARVAYGSTPTSGTEVLVAGSLRDADGEAIYYPEFDAPATNHGVFARGDFDRARRAFVKVSRGVWRLNGYLNRREKGIPTGAWDTIFNDDRSRTVDHHAHLGISRTMATGARGELLISGGLSARTYEGWYVYDAGALAINRDDLAGRWISLGARWTGPLGQRQRVVCGGDLRWNVSRRQQCFDEGAPPVIYLDRDDPSADYAFYMQDEVQACDRATLSIGVRHDRYEQFASTNPRLALIADAGRGATLKVLWGRAFRAPSAYEMYYGDFELWHKANERLGPERLRTWEVVWEQAARRDLTATVSLYHTQISDLISEVMDPADSMMVFANVDRVVARGLETSVDARLLGGLRGRASYSLQETRNRATDAILTNSPCQLVKLNLLAPATRLDLTAALELLAMSDRVTNGGGKALGHVVTNLTLSRESLLPGLDATLRITNLFDARYGDPASLEHDQDVIPREHRGVRVTFVYGR